MNNNNLIMKSYLSDSAEHRALSLGAVGLAPAASLLVASAATRGLQRVSVASEWRATQAGNAQAGEVRMRAELARLVQAGGEVGGAHQGGAALAGLRAELLDASALDELQTALLARAEECIPQAEAQLEVFLVGADAAGAGAGSAAGVRELGVAEASVLCAEREWRDIILQEPIAEALLAGERVVVAVLHGDTSMRSAQAYLAATLRRWLLELKRDGAGRVVGETVNVDPITRRQYTREQVVSVLLFGALPPPTQTGAAGGDAP
mmetsp:Transcript_5530/g.14438  ORF Transcript_5530/g.14438 Transcript_5530/m.14438 type:complete len:264 (+) Transcript_5530:463-1254(+)